MTHQTYGFYGWRFSAEQATQFAKDWADSAAFWRAFGERAKAENSAELFGAHLGRIMRSDAPWRPEY